MENLIPAVSKRILQNEIQQCRFIGTTRKGDNELYFFRHEEAPQLLREVGRLREYTFRAAGAGTGKALDLDAYDTGDFPYEQLIAWDPEAQEIIGGYRLISCRGLIRADRSVPVSSSGLFHFSTAFLDEYLPYTAEAGRSWIQPQYQCRSGNRKGLFALDNLWEGLGAFVCHHPDLRYLFGKVTLHRQFSPASAGLLLAFLRYFFPDRDLLVRPVRPVEYPELPLCFRQKDYAEALLLLKKTLRENGESIPPLIHAYMNLSPAMKTFGSTVNTGFGNVTDTGILIPIADIQEEKRLRYFSCPVKSGLFPERKKAG